MNLHADGWESDDREQRNRAKYKQLHIKYKKQEEEYNSLLKHFHELVKIGADLKEENEKLVKVYKKKDKVDMQYIKCTFQNILYYLIKYNWEINVNFTLTNIYTNCKIILQLLYPNNNSIESSIQSNMQKLRDKGYIEFIDNRGNYKRLC